MMNAKILLVDDEENIRKSLAAYLVGRGFTVSVAAGGEDALTLVANWSPDLIILDVQMPMTDGLEVCRAIRKLPNYIPILMISGVRKEVMDRVVGLEIGADKYLLKPFELPVLVAEVRSLLRMAQGAQSSNGPDGLIIIDEYLQIDRHRRQVRAGSRTVHLTVHEFDLLLYLIDHANTPCSRDDLIEFVWQDTSGGVSDQAVTSCVKRLRKKLEQDPVNPIYIQSAYGWGYKFCLVER